jgi:acyl-coenzyme A synthetase/AMP-(fatty) acid ligase
MFHAYGLGNSVFFPLFVGGSCVFISERPTPKAALAWANNFNVTLLFSVPTLFSLMLEAAERDSGLELPSLRLAISAAEPLSAHTVRRWKHRFGVDILDGVGSTEALHIYLSAREGAVKPGSVGIPVTGYDLDLRPDESQVVNDRSENKEVGTLWIRGDSVASEYWADPTATLRSIQDGWLNTGDRFYLDEDGHFYYVGRYDSMYRIGGKWVSAIEIEMILEEDPSISDAAVIAFLDHDGLPKLCACLVLTSEIYSAETVESRLRQLCENRLPLLKRPAIYHFADKIPRTSTGKKQRILLKEQIT